MRRRYLVVVHQPTPKHDGRNYSVSTADAPTVRWVTASSPLEAANTCNVPPGGKAEVAASDDVVTFTRAEQAPLVSDEPQVAVGVSA